MTKTLIFLTCFFVFVVTGSSQQKEIPVKELLSIASARHQVEFSYLDKHLSGIMLVPPADNVSLEELIHTVELGTKLVFKKIDSTNYAIIPAAPQKEWMCGFLIDTETNEPVPGALVFGNSYTTSNAEGYFQLQVKPNEILTIQHLAFKNSYIDLAGSSKLDCPTYYLQGKTTQLPQVTVYNYLSRGIHKADDGSLLFLVDPMRMLPGLIEVDILQALQVLPGISSINETVADINIRGGTNDQNLVLYDGIRVYQPGHFFGLISVFNAQNIKEARLIKQGSSAQFGDAVSGTILLQTAEAPPEKAKFTTGLNMLYADVAAELPLSKSGGIYVSARRSIGDIINTPTYQSYYSRVFKDTEVENASPNAAALASSDQRFFFYDTHVKYVQNLSGENRLSINFLSIVNHLNFTENAVINNIVESRTSTLSQNSLLGGVQYEKRWNKNFHTRLMLSASNYQLEANNVNIPEDQQLSQLNEVLDLQVKSVSKLIVGSTDLAFGYQGNNVGVTNGTQLNTPVIDEEIKKVISTHALFLDANRDFARSNVRLGIRSSFIPDLDKIVLEPRIAFKQQFSDHLSGEITGEMKSQSLFQKIDLQTDFLGIEKRKWILDESTGFQLVKSSQATAGLQYSVNKLLINIEGYFKDVDNIAAASQGFLNQFETLAEQGSYTVSGVDGLINVGFNKYNLWGSYSYAQNQYHFDNVIPNHFPSNFDIPHTISVGSNFQNNYLDVALGLNWHTGRPYTALLASDSLEDNQFNYAAPNERRLSNYFRIDASAKYQFNVGKTKIQSGVSFWNLLNRKNVINAYYRQQRSNIRFIKQYALPFTLNFSLRAYF